MTDFPKEFENTFIPIQSNDRINTNQGGSQQNGKCKLVRAPHGIYDKKQCILNSVGLLRVSFNDSNNNPPQYGTAVIMKTESGYLYLLTAAHNLVNWNSAAQTFNRPTKVWFELRDNNHPWKFWNLSSMKKRFTVKDMRIHPQYLARKHPASDCGYDIAVIKCGYLLFDNKHIQKKKKKRPRSIGTVDKLECIMETIFQFRENKKMGCDLHIYNEYTRGSIVGYPVDHKSEMYAKNGVFEESKSDEILVYKIATCRGQSGSPIFHQHINSTSDEENPFINLISIIGIHTGTDQQHNNGTKITKEKHGWIHKTINEMGLQTDNDLDILEFKKDKQNSKRYSLSWNGMSWSMDVDVIMNNILNMSQSKRAEAFAKYMFYTKKLNSVS